MAPVVVCNAAIANTTEPELVKLRMNVQSGVVPPAPAPVTQMVWPACAAVKGLLTDVRTADDVEAIAPSVAKVAEVAIHWKVEPLENPVVPVF